jgi:hypothetical protein
MVLALALIQSSSSSNGMGFISGIGTTLVTAAPYVGLCCLVTAGIALRGEGGTNFGIGGGFAKWLLWAFIFCALPTIPMIVNSLGNNQLGSLTGSFSGGTAEFTGLGVGVQTFIQGWIVGKAVPSIAGFLVVKAILDSNDGGTPFPSLISALFLLSVTGIWTMAQKWVESTDEYGITTGMSGALSYVLTTVCPIAASFCFIGAVVQFIKGRGWGKLVISGIAMLSATGIWALVQTWG